MFYFSAGILWLIRNFEYCGHLELSYANIKIVIHMYMFDTILAAVIGGARSLKFPIEIDLENEVHRMFLSLCPVPAILHLEIAILTMEYPRLSY